MDSSTFNTRLHDGDAFVARYTKRFRHLQFYAILWLIIAGGAYALLFDDRVREFLDTGPLLEQEGAGILLAVLGLFVGAMTLDLVTVIRALVSGKPALIIDREGVRGFTGGFWREIAWSEVGYIRQAANHFWFVRKPKLKITELNHAYTRPGSRRRWEYGIGVPLGRVDRTEAAIRGALREHRPDLA